MLKRLMAATLVLALLPPGARAAEAAGDVRVSVEQDEALSEPAALALAKELRRRRGLVVVDDSGEADVRVAVLESGMVGGRRVTATPVADPGSHLRPVPPAHGAGLEVEDTRRYVLVVSIQAGDEREELRDLPRAASLGGAAKHVAREVAGWIKKRHAELLASRR